MGAKHSLQVGVKAKGEIGPAGEEISSLLFRSVQELLLNVVKHAGVRTADLRVEVNGDNLHISVADKGRGFDANSVEQAPGASGFGLFSIRERLSLVGGRMEVRSARGPAAASRSSCPWQACDGMSGRLPLRRAPPDSGALPRPAAGPAGDDMPTFPL